MKKPNNQKLLRPPPAEPAAAAAFDACLGSFAGVIFKYWRRGRMVAADLVLRTPLAQNHERTKKSIWQFLVCTVAMH